MLKNNLFTIFNLSSDGADKHFAEIVIDPNHTIFDGHFPDQPILPGVCLLEIIRELLVEITQKTVQLDQAQNIKFLKVVDPRVDPNLKIELEILGKEKNIIVIASSFLQDTSTNFKLKAEYSLG